MRVDRTKIYCPRLPKGVSKAALKKGTKVELEHTADRKVAECIARAHLEESPYYYEELEKMERKLKRRR